MIAQTTAAQLRAMAGYAVPEFAGAPGPDDANAIEWLRGNGPPRVELPKLDNPTVIELMDSIRKREPEGEVLKKGARVKADTINDAIDRAEKSNEEIEASWDGILKTAAQIVDDEAKVKPGLPEAERAAKLSRATAAQAAGFSLEQRRYRTEATLNQGISLLYEARVKVSTAESDRHREKSKLLFFAMLAAQIGAVVSSLAMARKTRNALWVFASLIGLVSLGFGAYVFLET